MPLHFGKIMVSSHNQIPTKGAACFHAYDTMDSMRKQAPKLLINEDEGRAWLEEIDANGVSNLVEVLHDTQYPWAERKRRAMYLADLYKLAGPVWSSYRVRLLQCAQTLVYLAMNDGRRTLHKGMFCKLRLCPICATRRARKTALELSRAMLWVDAMHRDTKWLFLTLTVKNCSGNRLGDTISLLLTGWSKLRRHRAVARAVKGWYRALEITRQGDTYHPHLHVILCVESDYFNRQSGLYIEQKVWEQHWKQALGVKYRPRVDIRAAHGKGADDAEVAAAMEAAKYACKDTDYLSKDIPTEEAVKAVVTLTEALRGRRLTAWGGWLSDAVNALRLDLDGDDLIHCDGDSIREDIAELIEVYGWRFGSNDFYELLSREYTSS